jgi:hypothetical protein
MDTTYGLEILRRDHDSLEQVMSQIYTDMFNPYLRTGATTAFRGLLNLFTRRLAATTNTIEPNNRRVFYRIIVALLSAGVMPRDITVVTFNQDLQIEKCLALLRGVARWGHLSKELFNFPGCYRIGAPDVTGPSRGDTFSTDPVVSGALRVLKLHGSLNWYSTHGSRNPTPAAMFRADRHISITRRQHILTTMMRKRPYRSSYTLPVIVPPVSHKSAVLHQTLQSVWREAEDALRKADDVLIFGYSCPPLDVESSSLLRRSLRVHRPHVTVVDPAAGVAARYIELLEPKMLLYYPTAHEYLADWHRAHR